MSVAQFDPNEDKVPEPEKGLSHDEKAEVAESQRRRPAVVYEIIRLEGESELRRPFWALWWSGVAAGISIGFSFLTQAALSAHLPGAVWNKAIASMGYSVGFVIVILGRQQLFTENVLTAVLPVIARAKWRWFLSMLRLWDIVLVANIAGCCLFACAPAFLPITGSELSSQMQGFVRELMQSTPFEMFARGIGAGWLIAALAWIIAATEGLEIFVIALLTYLIALLGFTHIVAGSAEVLYGCVIGAVAASDATLRFFLPALAGNVFGESLLFSVLSYAQVREEIFEEQYWQKETH
jgi:formate/nitrite transporter FocA (FNT family)